MGMGGRNKHFCLLVKITIVYAFGTLGKHDHGFFRRHATILAWKKITSRREQSRSGQKIRGKLVLNSQGHLL